MLKKGAPVQFFKISAGQLQARVKRLRGYPKKGWNMEISRNQFQAASGGVLRRCRMAKWLDKSRLGVAPQDQQAFQ